MAETDNAPKYRVTMLEDSVPQRDDIDIRLACLHVASRRKTDTVRTLGELIRDANYVYSWVIAGSREG